MRIDIEGSGFSYDATPDTCPLCHYGIEPRVIGSNIVERDSYEGHILQILYRCPRRDCQLSFIATYWKSRDDHGLLKDTFTLRYTAPYRDQKPNIPDEIKALSENFTEIYAQAHSAEHYGLGQIVGVGYRKALEFLIKDFCISKDTDKAKEIKEKFLGACINEFVDDPNIKECARLATWLGNDETHYVRKWDDKDIKDLKILIELTMAWIRNHILTEQYLSDMNSAT